MMRPTQHTVSAPVDGTLVVTGTCPFTGATWILPVPVEGYTRWKNGMLIQFALPSLTAAERELLISGVTPAGWARV